MNKLSVYDLNSRETWQKLLDETQSALGMSTALLDPKNIILQSSSGTRNELCREIRSQVKAKPIICGQSQRFISDMARTQKSSVLEICEAGMAKLIVPIFNNKNYIGSISICGCTLPEAAIETYHIEKTTGIGGDAIAKMAKKVHTVQKEQVQQLAEDLFHRVNVS